MTPKRTTVYPEPDLHKTLKVKAAETHQSFSELVNGAVRRCLLEDAEDLTGFKQRVREPSLAFETIRKDLKRVDAYKAARRLPGDLPCERRASRGRRVQDWPSPRWRSPLTARCTGRSSSTSRPARTASRPSSGSRPTSRRGG